MTITAKFAGTCSLCKGAIAPGTVIIWEKGKGSTHADIHLCATLRAARAAQPVAAPVTVDLASVVTFLTAARTRGLKAPRTRFAAPGAGELALSLAPLSGKNPGAVYVKLNGEYAGKVTADGAVVGITPVLVDALRAIAADPAAAGAAYGRLTGRCSFCTQSLTDEGSIEVGYGPVCAKNYGLPHKPRGSAKVTPVLAPATPAWVPVAVAALTAYDAQQAGGDYDGTLDMNEARAVRPELFASDTDWQL